MQRRDMHRVTAVSRVLWAVRLHPGGDVRVVQGFNGCSESFHEFLLIETFRDAGNLFGPGSMVMTGA